FPGIRSDRPRLADSTGREHNRLRFEYNEPAVLAPVAKRARHTPAIHEEARDRTLHVHVKAHLDAAVLQRADHLQPGAVADVAQALESVSAKSALQDSPIFGAIKKRSPLFQFADPVGCLLCVQLSHAPVVEKLSAAHRVAE